MTPKFFGVEVKIFSFLDGILLEAGWKFRASLIQGVLRHLMPYLTTVAL
ncbi:hypothetical protein [Rickettsia canadensis]|nr:hypothetical protein [Rickettsia canadensis]